MYDKFFSEKGRESMNVNELLKPKKDRKRSPGSIVNDLIYLDKEFLAKMDFFFWEREKLKEATEKRKAGGWIIDEKETYYINDEGRPVFLSDVNRRLINTVEKYRQQKNDLIDEFLETGAVFTGRADYEYCIYRSK